MESIQEVRNNNSKIVHYQKINIFGDSGVGKSSLILHIENYESDDFKLKQNELTESQLSLDSNNSSFIVEQIKRVKVPINENNTLYLNLYETNLDNYNNIKMNLDTLLLQTECIILMWDNSRIDTLDNISNLFYTINQGIIDRNFRNVPIFLIVNKIDLDLKSSQRSEAKNININDLIDKFKNENKNIIYREISLLDRDNFYNLFYEIYRSISDKEKYLMNNDIVNLVKFNHIPIKQMNIGCNIMKCILLGHTCVGKTTFFKYLKGEKNQVYLSTIGIDQLIIEFSIDKEKGYLQLYDTSGQERFRSIASNYYKNSDGIILMYDVANTESFDSVDRWISDIKNNNSLNNLALILVANKIDEEKRIITKKQGIEKANEYNIKYFECCCLKGLNIFEIFNEIILEAYNKYNDKKSNNMKKSQTLNRNNSVRKSITKERKGCC